MKKLLLVALAVSTLVFAGCAQDQATTGQTYSHSSGGKLGGKLGD